MQDRWPGHPTRARAETRAGARDSARQPGPPRANRPTGRPLGTGRRRVLWIGRVRQVAVLLAVLVLAGTGYGWATLRQLDAGLVTSDVLGATARGAARADGATDILLVGTDSRTDTAGNPLPPPVLDQLHAGEGSGELNTDTMILLHIPTDPTRRAVAMSLPRDSYVSIPGYGTHKLNSAYARAAGDATATLSRQGVAGPALDQQSRQAGRRALAATVAALTGVTIDHYAEINLAGFFELSQAVGGVPVCLIAPVRDSYSGADFPAGPQTVQGAAALAFVRQRHGLPRGDLDRVVRQQAFLAGLAHTMTSTGTLTNPGQLTSLIDTVTKYVILDKGWDLLGFAAQAPAITGGNIDFRTMPTGRTDLPTPTDGDAIQVDPTQIHQFLTALTNPTPAAATSPANPTSPAPDPANPAMAGGPATQDIAVTIRNASGVSGLAHRTQTMLNDQGFAVGSVANTASPARTVVRYGPGQLPAARKIAAALGGMPVEAGPHPASGPVEVVLGADYTGPGAAGPGVPGWGVPGSGAFTTGVSDRTAAAPAPPAVPSITADGVPCIN